MMIDEDDLMMRDFIKRIIKLHEQGCSINQIVLITQGIYPDQNDTNEEVQPIDSKEK
jgi:hypothetical protein